MKQGTIDAFIKLWKQQAEAGNPPSEYHRRHVLWGHAAADAWLDSQLNDGSLTHDGAVRERVPNVFLEGLKGKKR